MLVSYRQLSLTGKNLFLQFFPRVSPRFSFQFSALFPFQPALSFRLPLFPSALSVRSASVLASLFFAPLELRTYSFRFAFASLRCRPFLPSFRLSPSFRAAVIASFRPLSQELDARFRLHLALSSHRHSCRCSFRALSSLRASLGGSFSRFRLTCLPCLSSHTLVSDGAFLLPDSVPFVPALLCTLPASLPASPLSFSGL